MLEPPESLEAGMPPRPGLLKRTGLVLLSLALPALMLAVTAACLFALTSMGNHDRTLVWVHGTPAQLAALERGVTRHPVFREGRVQAGAFERHRPDACPADMTSASFSRLHDYELLVAKSTLDALVRESGATPCRAHAFVFNDLPNPLVPGEWSDSLALVLLMLLLPSGTVLVAWWSCSAQFRLPRPLGSDLPARATATWSLGVAVAGLAAVATLEALWPLLAGEPAHALRLPSFSISILVVAGVYAPFLEETAFRGWLVPVASRAIGAPAAGLLSALAYAAVHLTGGAASTLAAFVLGGLLAALFLRTRSVWACLLAHGTFNGLALGLRHAGIL